MAAIRFGSNGEFKVEAGVNYVKATINISWNDDAYQYGTALKSLSFSADNRTVEWSRSDSEQSGNASRTFNISGNATSVTQVSVSYSAQGTSLRLSKESDKKLIFKDDDGSDANATITLSIDEVVRFDNNVTKCPDGSDPPCEDPPPERVDCLPGPWSEPVPPSCGSPPNALSSNDGLQITKTGQNQITLNLKNYANKLVTLKITHQVDGAWTQSFDFNIPTCSDISPNTGGSPYSKTGYSNSNITGTNTFYAYNVDGGDYNYVFNHSSIPGPAPWRQLYTEQCDTSCDEEGNCSTVCDCVEAGIEYFSPWPYCPTGVAISKNGGNKVQWQYEDGGGGNYDDQYVTVEVVSVRNAIGSTGSICTSALKNSVWLNDSADPSANGNCISDYKDHSQKIRFRIPSLQASKLSFESPLCYQEFRGIAGAIPPDEELGSTSSEYSVLHLFNRDFRTTTSLVSGEGIVVDSLSESDTYISPYNEDPSTNTNLGITDRRHYLVTFTDGTIVDQGAGNITISVGQSVTADGLNVAPVFFKKEAAGANSLRVWFYLNYQQNQQQTDDIIHVFDDDANATDETLSELAFDSVTVTPQALNDPGTGGDVEYQTLNALNKKHYLVTFPDTDSTIVSSDASNIIFDINQNKTASGDTFRINMVKRERVDDKNMRVWFTAYDTGAAPGLETQNTFVRDFSINRTRVENFSGNIFARSWYLSKNV